MSNSPKALRDARRRERRQKMKRRAFITPPPAPLSKNTLRRLVFTIRHPTEPGRYYVRSEAKSRSKYSPNKCQKEGKR